jgi:microcystin-dependent protein
MTDQFLGEIRMGGWNFAPSGWAACDGQILPISQNTALFSLLGTQFGGDGKSTFALPNLQGTIPFNQGQGPGLSPYVMGQTGGAETVTLQAAQLPAHTHQAVASTSAGNVAAAMGGDWAETRGRLYGPSTAVTMHPAALATTGSSQPHNNLPPYLVVTFVIALTGIFPSRS